MARSRTDAKELTRLFDAVARPIYVLDEEQGIAFCNRSCLDWLGSPAEAVLGQRCIYGPGAEGAADPVAAGLCPPPGALRGQETEAVVGASLADGRFTRRRARFFPLRGDAETVVAVLAIVDPEEWKDSETAPSPACPTEAALLHERLRRFRHQRAGQYRLDRFVGTSPAIRRARSQIELAWGSRANAVIVGPPGSGRQHAAQTIHYGATEPSGPLVPLACTVLAADVIASTLAAIASQRLPQDASGHGTLLLNDVDQLAAEAQAEVAHLLAGKRFPLRIVATAREDLVDLTRQGKYREDLAAALSTLVIRLPPLAERRGDIPVLSQHFVEEANTRSGKQVAGLSSEALDRLEAYPWPGNVDELNQVIDEAHRAAEGLEIVVGDLPPSIHLAHSAAARPRRHEETIVLEEFLARIEREMLVRALRVAKGNKTKAARLLGMTRPKLYRRLVQLGLEEPPQ